MLPNGTALRTLLQLDASHLTPQTSLVNMSNDAAYPPSSTYLSAYRFLRAVVALVSLYGLGMVFTGQVFAVQLFDFLQFGPNTRGLSEEGVSYAIFAFGVLGAVLVGWMMLILGMLDLAVNENANVRKIARRALANSTALWFVLDTGFSLATAEIEHALFNIPFVTFLGVPLFIMSVNDDAPEKTS